MKNLFKGIFFACVALCAIASCKETETYAEQKEYEASRIGDFIAKRGINVITEEQFAQQGYSTDVEKNEYVLFASQGVYMQIVNKGTGKPLKDGETETVLVRFQEWNINGDSTQISNEGITMYAPHVDKMTVKNTSGTFTASFTSGLMMTAYGSGQVPSGWLLPFRYINLGRPEDENSSNAIVNLIVPHDKGQAYATSRVYACHYTLDMRRGAQ